MKKILILAPNWIGDAVLSLPVVDASVELWPNSEIWMLADKRVAQIYSARNTAVQVLEYQRRTGHPRLGDIVRLGRRLRRERFRLALLLPNSFSSALVTWSAGIPQRVGYATDWRGWLLTHHLRSKRKERGLHQVDYYIELLRSLGATEIDRIPHLRLTSEVIELAPSLLGDLSIGKDETLIGVHPGAAYGEAKRWFPERFAAVLDRLQKSPRRFLLFGGPGEETLAERLSAAMHHRPANLVGKTTVSAAMALINNCDLFLSNDSGLMHVAAALGVPQVALFGSTDPKKTRPLNERAVVVHPAQVECTPCFKPHCPQDLECMEAITVDEVYAAAERLLSEIESGDNEGGKETTQATKRRKEVR
ncbi:MAG: lipopolysaccharide heptosyltransferase II [Deltaproteobacteria bacterium]|nr:MAG: lipopolysaccharide heptosyltransferase II [Deltaproteobacteria bacterium]